MKVQFASLDILSNWKTILVHFFLLPVIDLVLLCGVSSQYASSNLWTVAAASVLLSAALCAMRSVTDSFVADRDRGIDREMLAQNPWSLYYWGGKFLCAGSLAAVLALGNLLLMACFSGGRAPLLQALGLLPQMIFSGLALGYTCAVAGWNNPNPYFWSNLVANCCNVFSGALIAFTLYPPWMQPFTDLFPFAHTLGQLWGLGEMGSSYFDFIVAAIWLAVGVALYARQVRAVRRSARFSIL